MVTLRRATVGWAIVVLACSLLSATASGCFVPVGGCGAPEQHLATGEPTPSSPSGPAMSAAPLAESCEALDLGDFEAACGAMTTTTYASADGSPSGFGTPSSPVDLPTALARCAGRACRIRVAAGTHVLTGGGQLAGCISLEGGYGASGTTWVLGPERTTIAGTLNVSGRAWIQNVDLDSGANGIVASPTTGQLVVRDVTVHGAANGVVIGALENGAQTRLCDVQASGTRALFVAAQVRGLRLERGDWQGTDAGVWIAGSASDVELRDASIFGGNAGVRIDSGSSVVLRGNAISSYEVPVESANADVSSIDNEERVTPRT